MRAQDQGDVLRPGLRPVARSACPSSSTSTPSEARGLMDEYFERFGGVRDYLRDVVAEARRTGYTETMLGRRRYLPDLTSDNRQRREMAERMALNAPIQGSAADIIKVAMLGVDRALADAGLRSRMLLQVHDELVLEVAPGERDGARGAGPPARWAAADLLTCRSTCPSASAAPGTTPRTEVAAHETAAYPSSSRAPSGCGCASGVTTTGRRSPRSTPTPR